jgi:two-component system phosphate regulon response regulator PhoB
MSGAAPRKVRKSILIVEDERDLADLIGRYLTREGYQCACAFAGDEAMREINRRVPDLLLLDRMLPGLSGDDLVAELRRNPTTASTPVVMLTAKAEEADQLVGFALGADDYITKPFSMNVLAARIAAVLRRGEMPNEEPQGITAGPFRLLPAHHELIVDGQPVALTATEFRLLRVLMQARGRVLDRSQLIGSALGEDVVVTDRTIDVHITAIRKKLGSVAAWVQTIRGVGYAFRQPAEAETVSV